MDPTRFNHPDYPNMPPQPAELDEDIVKFLGSLGAVSREALPVLLAAKTEFFRRASKECSAASEPRTGNEDDCCPEYLNEAIKRMQIEDRT